MCLCVRVHVCVCVCERKRGKVYLRERVRGEDKKQRNITEAAVEFIESSFHRWFDLLLSPAMSCMTASAVFFDLKMNFITYLLNETV